MLLPAADFASSHGFRRPQARTTATPKVRRLDFPFAMSPAFACKLLGERRQVSTPSSSLAPLRSVQQGLARDWHRSGEENPPFERKAFPVFDACSPHGFPCGDPCFPLFSLLLVKGSLPREQGGRELRVCCVYRFRHSRSRTPLLTRRRCNGNNYWRC